MTQYKPENSESLLIIKRYTLTCNAALQAETPHEASPQVQSILRLTIAFRTAVGTSLYSNPRAHLFRE